MTINVTRKPPSNGRIFVPPNPLSAYVDRDGGIARKQAIAAAQERIEAMRGSSMDALDLLITKLEETTADKTLTPKMRIGRIADMADQVVTLSGTYGLNSLCEAAKRLCDLTAGLIARDLVLEEPLLIHVRALRLFGPKGAAVPPDAAKSVLMHLRKVLAHFEIEIPAGA